MKNFTLFLLSACLFLTNHLSAQFAVYTEGYGASATFAPFGGSVNNITEDMTMANAHTGTKSLRAEVPAAGYTGGAIVAPMPQNFTAYTAVTFWVRASASKTLNVAGFANNAVSAPRQTEKANIPVSTTWTKVTIPIPNPAILTAEDGLFHFAEGSDEGAYTLWFDDIQYENIAVVGDPTPTVAAPTPTRAAADVISLFSGSPYTDLAGTNWNPYNGGTGYSAVPIASNLTQKYTNLSYSVSELAANADLTAYSGFHVDFWSATAVNFKVKLVDFGADGAYAGGDDKEGEVDKGTQAAGAWVSLDIPLADFAAAGFTTKAHFRQLVISTTSSSPLIYLDNLYFYKTTTVVVPTAPTVAAPTPTNPAANVVSLFSGLPYSDLTGTNWNPYNGGTTYAEEMIAGNSTQKYGNLGYSVSELAANRDLTNLTFLHLDYWSATAANFKVKLVDFGADGMYSPGVDDREGEVDKGTQAAGTWVSLDIPLADFAALGFTTRAHFRQFIISTSSTLRTSAEALVGPTIYLDNIYFYSNVALSVELASFTAKAVNKTAVLNWKTASEHNNQGFTIEQSSNGITYNVVGQVKGHGTSNVAHNYTFTDNTPSVNANYYRLRQTDFDGKETVSPVVSVLFGKGGLVLKNTLAHDALEVLVSDESPVLLSVFNASGQEVYTTKAQGTQRIDVSAWVSGLYIVRTATGEVSRFVKQ